MRKLVSGRLLQVSLAFLLLAAAEARAARNGRVESDGTQVYQMPSASSKVIKTLTKDTVVRASNLPVNGFFKVRTPEGEIGWVQSDELIVAPLPPESLTDKTVPLTNGAVDNDNAKSGQNAGPQPLSSGSDSNSLPDPNSTGPASSGGSSSDGAHFRIRALGSFDIFNVSDVNSLVDAGNTANDPLVDSYSFGMEIGVAFSSGLSLGLRVESLSRTAQGADNAVTPVVIYNYALASIPLMVGGEFSLLEGSGARLGVGGYFGVAVGTALSVTTTLDQTTISSTPFTAFLKADLDLKLLPFLWIYGEAGYRLLDTSALTPGGSANSTPGSSAQALEQNGQFVPVTLNMTGPVFSAGLTLNF